MDFHNVEKYIELAKAIYEKHPMKCRIGAVVITLILFLLPKSPLVIGIFTTLVLIVVIGFVLIKYLGYKTKIKAHEDEDKNELDTKELLELLEEVYKYVEDEWEKDRIRAVLDRFRTI